MTLQIENINKVNSLLEKSLSNYESLLGLSEESIEVVNSEIQSLYPECSDEVGKFYIYVGCVAVINDIDILNQAQMKNSLGFAELTSILECLFEDSGSENLVPTIQNSSSVFNTIYSETDLASFGSSWGTHVQDDVRSINKMINKEEQPTEATAYKNLKEYFSELGDDSKFKYDAEVDNILGFLRDEYESTYQLIKPKGIVVPSPDEHNTMAMIGMKGSQGNLDFLEGTSNLFRNISKNLNNTFNISDEVDVNITDDTFSIKAILQSPKRVFFVRPHLKLLFGRNLFSKLGENGKFERPMGNRKYPTWASAEDEVRKFVEHSFQNLIIYHFRNQAKDWYDIDVENNNMASSCNDFDNLKSVMMIEDVVLKDFKKLSASIITTYFISEFGGTKESPSKISIRGTFKENNTTPESLFTKITQDSGKRITEEDKVVFTPRKTIQSVPLNNLVIHQYEHIFNNASANAVPLFAAKALEYIEQNIKYVRSKDANADISGVSWENLLVGMTKDGFIEQGQEKLQLIKNIVHWLSAGSRAGKGVASYNLIIPQVLEDRLVFYGDRKPDTVIVLAQQAGLNPDGTPRMAYVNGGQFNAVSPENEKYISWQEKLIAKNKPKWLDINDRSTLDDLIYLRQAMVVFSIIDMMTVEGLPNVNTALGFAPDYIKGISAIFDEYTNFQKGFLERLDPFTTSNSLLKGVLNEDIFELIEDVDSDSYKAVEKKGLLKQVTMSNTWKMSLMNSLIDANTNLSFLKNAGLQQISSFIDILVIGQGFRGENTKFVYDLQKGKRSGEYIKGTTLPGLNTVTLDPLTTLLKIIPNHDYILGTPPDFENGQNYDLVDANGKNFDTYGHYLNRNYRGFAYISRTDIDNNPTNGFIFKPFLLLNEGTEPQELKDMAKLGKTDKGLMQEAIKTYQNKAGGYLAYLANEVDNIKGTSWLEVRKELTETLGLNDKGESLAGVIPYSEKIGFNPEKYNKTIIFMDEVVKRLGYPGSYHEFVCDLRPEWMMGVTDFRLGVFEGLEAYQSRSTLNGLRSYVNSPVYNENTDLVDKSIIGLGASEVYSEDDDYDSDENLQNFDEFPDYEDVVEPVFDTEETKSDVVKSSPNFSDDTLKGVDTGIGAILSGIGSFQPSVDGEDIPNLTEKLNVDTPISQDSVFDDFEEESVLSRGTEVIEPNSTKQESVEPIIIPEKVQSNEDYEQEERDKKREVLEKEQQMTSEQREYYYMGVKDAMSGNTAFKGISKIKLNSLGMTESYETGYITGFEQSPKRMRIEMICATNLPEAKETSRVLGITQGEDSNSIMTSVNSTFQNPINKEQLKNPRNILQDPIIRHVPAKVLSNVEQNYGDMLNERAISSYGVSDAFVVGGKIGTITNLDVAITAPYEPKNNPETGKYDPDYTLTEYIQVVTEQIINKVGSYRQFNSITVTNNGQMIVNDMLRMQFAVPKREYDRLPWGIKVIVDNQEWAKLFSWKELHNMNQLSTLTVDSMNFVMSYIRPFLSKQNTTIDQSLLLREYTQLYAVIIEGDAVTRAEIKPENYWKDFRLKASTSSKDFRTYTSNRFEHLKGNVKDSYDKDKNFRSEMKKSRNALYDSEYKDYVASAETRSERVKRKREVQQQMSSDCLKEAYKQKDFRRLVSEAGYGLKVIPGLLIAKLRR